MTCDNPRNPSRPGRGTEGRARALIQAIAPPHTPPQVVEIAIDAAAYAGREVPDLSKPEARALVALDYLWARGWIIAPKRTQLTVTFFRVSGIAFWAAVGVFLVFELHAPTVALLMLAALSAGFAYGALARSDT